MDHKLLTIDEQRLFDYLNSKDGPLPETELIREFVPQNLSLFVRHFSLYHALYKLKFAAGSSGYYLHLDCMRIRLARVPLRGLCGHYDPQSGTFCGAFTDSNYCYGHTAGHGDYRNSVTFDILMDFYLDPGNIGFGESPLLKKLMSGIKVYCVKKREIDEALELFGLSKPDRDNISARYRELAVKFHPDLNRVPAEMMKKINSAYAVLKEVYIL